MLSPGAVLSGRYRLVEHLAAGGMGDVWQATDTVLGRTVAVKVLLPALLAGPGFGTRFAAEARMMAALQHSGIANVYDYGESDLPGGARAVYLVMEHVAGESLAARLKENGRLDVATSLSIVAQAADALHAAHTAGIIHRDVKPGNLLVRPTGTVTLVDFGIARSAAGNSVTGTNDVVGTALYMAPEQAAGRPVSPATDIYALGAVAYHCVTGSPPFAGGTPLDIAIKHLHEEVPPLPPDVPAGVAALVARALEKEPADRFATAEAMAAAARAAMDAPTGAAVAAVPSAAADAPTAIAQPASIAAAGRPTRRRTPVAALAAAGLLAAAALTAAWAFAPDGISPADGGPAPAPTRSVQPVDRPSTSGTPDGAAPGQGSGTTAQPGSGSRPAGAPTPGAPGTGASTAPGAAPAPGQSAAATPLDPPQPSAPATSAPAAGPTPGDPTSPEPSASTSAPAPSPSGQAGGQGGGGTAPPDEDATSATTQPTGVPGL